ncbi:hypothetical protein C8R44DRAFT_745797 [Mycena epipterygia]|nr:hypothetical protein C8R44DRAFT_745797 [Mycena epipterygia]
MAWPPRPSRACILFGMSRSSPIGLDFWDKVMVGPLSQCRVTTHVGMGNFYNCFGQEPSPIGEDLDMPNRIHAREGRGGQAIKEKYSRSIQFSAQSIENREIWAILSRGSKTAQNRNFLVAPSRGKLKLSLPVGLPAEEAGENTGGGLNSDSWKGRRGNIDERRHTFGYLDFGYIRLRSATCLHVATSVYVRRQEVSDLWIFEYDLATRITDGGGGGGSWEVFKDPEIAHLLRVDTSDTDRHRSPEVDQNVIKLASLASSIVAACRLIYVSTSVYAVSTSIDAVCIYMGSERSEC